MVASTPSFSSHLQTSSVLRFFKRAIFRFSENCDDSCCRLIRQLQLICACAYGLRNVMGAQLTRRSRRSYYLYWYGAMACVCVSTPELKCCPMCSYGTYQEPHVCSIHRYDPNFIVYCTSCLRSFTKWDSFRKHMYRGCKGIEPTPGNKETVSQVEIFEHMPEMTDGGGDLLSKEVVPTDVPLKWHAATFILSIREHHLLPQVAVDTVVSSTTSLMSNVLGDILHDLRESLPIEAVETLDRKAEDGLFNASHLFEGLSTPYLQKKFFKEHCHLVVS